MIQNKKRDRDQVGQTDILKAECPFVWPDPTPFTLGSVKI